MAVSDGSLQNRPASRFVVKCMEEREIDGVLGLINAEEGWYLPREKVEMYCQTLEDSIYIIVDPMTQEILGCLTVVPAHSYDAVIGHMLVKKGRRRQGLGSQLLQYVVDRQRKSGQSLSLYSQNDIFYQNIGFKQHHPPSICYQMTLSPDQASIDRYNSANPLDNITNIMMYDKQKHLDSIIFYDAEAEGYENRPYINVLLGTCTGAVVAVDEDSGRVNGYATTIFRRSDSVLDFLGVIADSDVIAFWLLKTMLQHMPDVKKFRISVTKKEPFLKQFGQVIVMDGGFNRLVIGDADVQARNEKCYSLKGADASY